jgi:hypothetical protein
MSDIKAAHLTYLHSLYRESTSILGKNATFAEITSQINLLLTVDDARPTIQVEITTLV